MFKRFMPTPNTLAAKLALSHALTTLIVIVTIVIVFQIIFYVISVQQLQGDLQRLAQGLENYSEFDYERIGASDVSGVNDARVDESINDMDYIAEAFRFLGYIRSVDSRTVFMLTDAEGILIESSQPKFFSPQTSLYSYLDAEDKSVLDGVLAGESSYNSLSPFRFNIFGDVFATAPLFNPDESVKAAIVIRLNVTLWLFIWDFIETLLYVLAIFIILAIPLIIFLSRRQGKRLASRIERLADVAKNWANGNLSTHIQDERTDEIGDLSRDLNAMALQFQQLLETKGELAVIKERNRLAIELHDSVKQQVFAIGLKIATIESKIDDVASKKHLMQMQTMVQNVKQELNRLIHELKPSELEQQDFLTALKEYAKSWSESHGIAVDVSYYGNDSGNQLMVPELEQSFFRITQEALANVLKHSKASQVEIEVDLREDYRLSIEDNGQGFNQEDLESSGIGLQVMKERIEKLGGQFLLSSFPNKGTRIEAFCSPDIIKSIFKTDVGHLTTATAKGASI